MRAGLNMISRFLLLSQLPDIKAIHTVQVGLLA
jgi:hypothetical protein